MQRSIRTLEDLQTPALLLDRERMSRNITRLKTRLRDLGVKFRPHVKTAKSIEVAREMIDSDHAAITASTLKEAEQFAAAGIKDILYAVGIAPNKLHRVADLRRKGVDLAVILDNVAQATEVSQYARATGDPLPVLMEIDSDGHRAGVQPGDPLLIEIGRILTEGGAELRGVMTHGGGSYDTPGSAALERAAEAERAAVVQCAEALRSANMACPIVSVGSTPTAWYAHDLTGVTEVRAGVFVFFDLVMAGLGVCTIDDIAISVLTTVIGHQQKKGWTVVDAGWMAMSRDRGTARQARDYGYGLACDLDGRSHEQTMIEANQEHGILCGRSGASEGRESSVSTQPARTSSNSGTVVSADFPVGSLLRILPNHACATAAQHAQYFVIAEGREIVAEWPRFSGW